jgi:hypothetical protein
LIMGPRFSSTREPFGPQKKIGLSEAQS